MKMKEDKPIEVTGSDSTRRHQNAHHPPLNTTEDKNHDEHSFEISSMRLSDNQDESPLEASEDAPKSPMKPSASPFRTRLVGGYQSPNSSFGLPNVQSPVSKDTPALMELTSSELSEEFEASDLAKEFLSVDRSTLDASVVTNSLLESPSFTSSDDYTNAQLEAAYMWTQRESLLQSKREYNSLLQKIKDLEEAAAAREQAKLDQMMTGIDSDSPLKWAQEMIGQTGDSESSTESERNMDEAGMSPMLELRTKLPSELYPTELDDLALPTLSPRTTHSELRTIKPSNLEETADTTSIMEKKARPSSSFRRMMLLFLLAFVCIIILSVHRASIEFVLKEAMSKVAQLLKEHENRFHHASETRELVHTKLQPEEELITPRILESAIASCQQKYEQDSRIAMGDFKKLQNLLIGLKLLDWNSEILPKRYSGKRSNAALEGMNVVVASRAFSEVGKTRGKLQLKHLEDWHHGGLPDLGQAQSIDFDPDMAEMLEELSRKSVEEEKEQAKERLATEEKLLRTEFSRLRARVSAVSKVGKELINVFSRLGARVSAVSKVGKGLISVFSRLGSRVTAVLKRRPAHHHHSDG